MPCNAHEFAENKGTLVRSFLSHNKLHAGGIHAITKWGNNAQIRHRKKRIKLVLLNGLVTK